MSFRGPAILVLGTLMVAANARAEFVTGKTLPGFSLGAADGSRVEASVADEAWTIKATSSEMKPKATVIHLLQPDCLQCRAQGKETKPKVAVGFFSRY